MITERGVLSELAVIAIVICAVSAWITEPERARKTAKQPWHMGPIEAWYARNIYIPWRQFVWRIMGPAVALLLIASSAAAQLRAGYVLDPARAMMEADWDSVNPGQHERAYCVTRDTTWASVREPITVTVVTDVRRAPVTFSSPMGVNPLCGGQPEIHVHTPTTCFDGNDAATCLLGGHSAYDCNESPLDVAALRVQQLPYGAIQCERRVIAFYFPETPPPRTTRRLRGSFAPAPAGAVAPAVPLTPAAPAPRRRLTNNQFLTPLALGIAANTAYPFDRDPGGYRDRWTTPDKATHALAGYAIASLGLTAGVDRDIAFFGTCATAAAFEFTQGAVSGRDIVAGCAGAAVAVLWDRLFR